jgi:hypothetical protein
MLKFGFTPLQWPQLYLCTLLQYHMVNSHHVRGARVVLQIFTCLNLHMCMDFHWTGISCLDYTDGTDFLVVEIEIRNYKFERFEAFWQVVNSSKMSRRAIEPNDAPNLDPGYLDVENLLSTCHFTLFSSIGTM